MSSFVPEKSSKFIILLVGFITLNHIYFIFFISQTKVVMSVLSHKVTQAAYHIMNLLAAAI